MATPSTQLDPTAVLAEVRMALDQLLSELGLPTRGLARADFASLHLDRDLGLGSLERVELLLRLGEVFHVRLPDDAVAEADTVEDVVAALLQQLHGSPLATPAQEEFARPREAARPGTERLPAFETLVEALRWRAREDPERPHIFLREDQGTTHTVRYGELLEQASALAAELRGRGLQPREAVSLMLPTSREFFVAFLGILIAGGVPVPIYPPFRADRVGEYAERQAAILRNAEARFLITFRAAARVARLLKPRVPSLQGVLEAGELSRSGRARTDGRGVFPRVRADDLALIQYTSGSTGDPKGVALTHANLLANIRAICQVMEVRDDDVGVTWLPLYHDMGLIGTWLLPLCRAIPVVVMSPLAFLSRPERWLWAFHHHRGTLSAAPNFAYELCARKVAARDIEGLDLSSWRAALNGAEPVNAETLERFAGRFAAYGFRPEVYLPVYGLAEASLALTIPEMGRGPVIDRIERESFEREGRAVPVTAQADPSRVLRFVGCGRPIPGHEVRIVDEQGRAVPERVEGRLWFRGASTTRGYYRNPEATRAIQRGDAWMDSGDRAYRVGDEIFLTGRAKDVIIKAGRNIAPQEVEEIAAGVAGVRKGCVVAFGLRDENVGTERLVVVAETKVDTPGERQRLAQGIRERITESLGLPPDVVELVPPRAIPKTSSGKLRRSETKALYLAGKLTGRQPPVWMQVSKLAAVGAAQTLRGRLRRALEILYGVYALAWFCVWLPPTWALMMLMPSRRAVVRFTSAAARLYFRIAGMPLRVIGCEHLENVGPCVFVSNHASYYDVLLLMAAFPFEFRFVSKIEVRSMPFIGSFLRRREDFAFDRSDAQARLHQVEEVEQALRRGDSVWFFPEGTFTPHDGVRAFQLGAFKAAVATGRPMVPVALRGARNILRDETVLPRPGSVTITILPPVRTEAVRGHWREIVRLRDSIRAAIALHAGEPLL